MKCLPIIPSLLLAALLNGCKGNVTTSQLEVYRDSKFKDRKCPTWFVPSSNNTGCECGADLTGIKCKRNSKEVWLYVLACMTYDNATKNTLVGRCPFSDLQKPSLENDYVLVVVSSSSMPSNNFIVLYYSHFSRQHYFCFSECICFLCSGGVLWYSTISTGIYWCYWNIISIYPCLCYIWWFLEFRFLPSQFCISDRLTNLHMLTMEYLVALFPLFLTALTYIFIQLHARDCRILVTLWRPCSVC